MYVIPQPCVESSICPDPIVRSSKPIPITIHKEPSLYEDLKKHLENLKAKGLFEGCDLDPTELKEIETLIESVRIDYDQVGRQPSPDLSF